MKRLMTSIILLFLALSILNAKANDVPRQNGDDTLRDSNHPALDYCHERQPKVSHFLTVDPKADQYPGINSYLYCAGNPMMYVDPTGEIVGIASVTGEAGAGMGVAVSATVKCLVAFDNYGITIAAEHSCRYVCNQNLQDGSNDPSILVGAALYVSLDFTYNWSAKSFYEQKTSSNFSNPRSSFGLSLGDNEVSYSKGLGFSCKLLDRNPMQIDFAISLSYEEFQGNFGIWTVTSQKLCRDGKGNHYFTGSLEVNCKETNIQLRSEAVYKDGKWVSNNIWKSNKYIELENER